MKIGSYIALKEKLCGEYLEKFNFVENYGELHLVSAEVMAEKMMDLMDLMLEAQDQELPVEHIVGKDIKGFCKNYFSDVTVADLLRSVGKEIRSWAWLVFALELLLVVVEIGNKDFHFFSYKTDVSGYLVGAMVGWSGVVLADLVGIVLAKLGCYTQKTRNVEAFIIAIVTIGMIIFFIGEDKSLEILGWPLLLFSGLYLLAYYGLMFRRRYQTTGSFRKQKNENEYETSFTGLLKEELYDNDYSRDVSVVKIFSKRYVRKNRRRMKQGKPRLTTEEFFEKEDKAGKRGVWVGFAIGTGIGVIGILIPSICSSESFFEGPADLAGFSLVMAVALLLMAKFVIKLLKPINKVAHREGQDILSACREGGVELDKYYEMLAAGELEEKDSLGDRNSMED